MICRESPDYGWRPELRVALDVLTTRALVGHQLRKLPLDHALGALTPRTTALGDSSPDPRAIERVERWTRRLLYNRRIPRTTCMQRALTRYVMLRRLGLDAHFVMGLAEDSDRLVGHAWVTIDGEPLMEETPPDFAKTFEYPRSAPSPSSPPR